MRELLEGLPGELIVAVRVAVRAGRRKAGPAGLGDFDPQSMCVSQTNSGGARVATDIKPDTAGFVRFLVEAGDLPPGVSGALVQRLLEIETYRCLALLGLPLAHKVSSKVRAIEQSLAAVTAKMQAARGLEDNRALLETLAALATEVEALSAETSYRFSASRAYSQIVAGRLEALEETAYDQAPAIGSFLSRRMAPAMRTCESIERRIEDLSDKLSRAATLLRARVDVELESQNRNLLATMNRRARQQLRLQHTVEGLSVAAVSYYVVGLVSYVIKGAKGTGMDLPTQTLTAMAVPVVVALVWLTVRRIRAAHGDEEEG